MSPAPALAGRHIVVTRPPAQAAALASAIEAAGGVAVLFPVLEIGDPPDTAALDAAMARLDQFDLAVFVSPNAVERGLAAVTSRRAWPPGLRAAAMGPASAAALRRGGVQEVLLPADGSDSEALLACPELQAERIRGRQIVVFRGDGGRELLAESLLARGAGVERVTCYRRGRPALDAAPLRAQLAEGAIAAVTVTSSEGLRNLVAMVGTDGAAQLKDCPLFAAHARICAEAQRMGFRRALRTAAGDAGLLAGLVGYFASDEGGGAGHEHR